MHGRNQTPVRKQPISMLNAGNAGTEVHRKNMRGYICLKLPFVYVGAFKSYLIFWWLIKSPAPTRRTAHIDGLVQDCSNSSALAFTRRTYCQWVFFMEDIKYLSIVDGICSCFVHVGCGCSAQTSRLYIFDLNQLIWLAKCLILNSPRVPHNTFS